MKGVKRGIIPPQAWPSLLNLKPSPDRQNEKDIQRQTNSTRLKQLDITEPSRTSHKTNQPTCPKGKSSRNTTPPILIPAPSPALRSPKMPAPLNFRLCASWRPSVYAVIPAANLYVDLLLSPPLTKKNEKPTDSLSPPDLQRSQI